MENLVEQVVVPESSDEVWMVEVIIRHPRLPNRVMRKIAGASAPNPDRDEAMAEVTTAVRDAAASAIGDWWEAW